MKRLLILVLLSAFAVGCEDCTGGNRSIPPTSPPDTTIVEAPCDTVFVVVAPDTIFVADEAFMECVRDCMGPPHGNPLNLCIRACLEVE